MEAYARDGMPPEDMMARANAIILEADFQIATMVYMTLEPRERARWHAGWA